MDIRRNSIRKLTPVSWTNVSLEGGLLGGRQEINRKITLPAEYDQCQKAGLIDIWKFDLKPGQYVSPHFFRDSDIAKWIEAAAYSIAILPDAELEESIDRIVDLMAAAQQEDGYLNSYFQLVEPENRFTNLRDKHELYCAGHLIEAAVAYYQASGKRKFLNVMCRYADLIDSLFGHEEGKIKGYDGHEEIELALMKLYRVTGNQKYLKLSKFFIDERGSKPYFFDVEAEQRKEDISKHLWKTDSQGEYCYYQSHLPIRQLEKAVGHAVRAMYYFAGATDVALETGDTELLKTIGILWDNVTLRQMHITGGIGPKGYGERFTFDYDLPDEFSYNETCASIGLIYWAHRLMQHDGDGKYADVIERVLYNNILGSVSLEGDKFFYSNPLSAYPAAYSNQNEVKSHMALVRKEWFSCACCPPNLARVLSSIGEYIYSTGEECVYVHQFVQGKARIGTSAGELAIEQKTGYPWDGSIALRLYPENENRFDLYIRWPGWCREASVKVNGDRIEINGLIDKGYIKIKRLWKKGDFVELNLHMVIERMEANPAVRMSCGRIALQRGPVVYCLEEIDNGKYLDDIILASDAELRECYEPDLMGGVVVIEGKGNRRNISEWRDCDLYKPKSSSFIETEVRAVPYFARLNRTPGEMIVWLQKG